MFLRSLYGSRMPQARHPRADEQISNYWREDTESSRELARLLMDEMEEDATNDDDLAKKAAFLPAVLTEDGSTTRRGSQHLNASSLLATIASSLAPLDSLSTLNLDEMQSTPIQAQLSPTGLISIAAADIDEAASRSSSGTSLHLQTRELDLDMLESIRRAATATPQQILVENFMARILAASSSTSATTVDAPSSSESPLQEEESPLRFLSLLRRINELRSQQVQQDSEVWDGLPYPQILALPTFRYTARRDTTTTTSSSSCEEHINNTLCAVCYTEYEQEEEVRALPCLHFYHRECIDQWLLHHRMCPICKHIVAVY